jgi:transposase-like protein
VSCKQFAGKHGLSSGSLYRWAQQLDDASHDGATHFTEVRVVGAALGQVLEVQHPSGCVVRLSGAVDEAQLTAVLRALSAC